jgi:hypothetical protein
MHWRQQVLEAERGRLDGNFVYEGGSFVYEGEDEKYERGSFVYEGEDEKGWRDAEGMMMTLCVQVL